jgi:hypothetical protein
VELALGNITQDAELQSRTRAGQVCRYTWPSGRLVQHVPRRVAIAAFHIGMGRMNRPMTAEIEVKHKQ